MKDQNDHVIDASKTATEGASSIIGISNINTHDEPKNAKETPKGVYTHKFKKPFKYEGKVYVTLDFHFGKLTGHDMTKIEQELQDENTFVMASEVSKTFQCKLAARAARIGSDVIMSMPLPDFNKITNEVRNFLVSTGY